MKVFNHTVDIILVSCRHNCDMYLVRVFMLRG